MASDFLADLLDTADFRVGVAWLSLDGTPRLLHHQDERFYAASTMKVAVMVAVHQAVERGELALTDKLPLTDRYVSVADGSTYQLDPDDSDVDESYASGSATVEHLVEQMITVSSNEATNLLIAALGGGDVRAGVAKAAEAQRRLSATGSQLQRPIGDLAANGTGLSNLVTAYDLAAGLGRLVSGQVAGPAATEAMTATLCRQQRVETIAAGLPAGTRWGGKNGWVDGIRHDSGVVWPPDAPPYALAVCTADFGADETAIALIRTVSARVYAARSEFNA
ncbi:serine hydrolase [Fodinicola acaciae]|uniref:serine hydrolase n=1 Tax=Fodinicola acaciae TaxID=2681555 RepID=UPI0013D84C1B|nr:serine hydrolase [Fodinicola acaciae]